MAAYSVMVRSALIRPWKAIAQRHVWDGMFCVLSVAALIVGAAPARDGAEKFLGLVLPGVAAPASDEPAAAGLGIARLPMFGFAAPSPYAPQVLFPVASHAFPDWLTGAGVPAPSSQVQAPQVQAPPLHAPPAVAICIDDLGEDIAGTDRAMALPRNVALSFLPFAETTSFLAVEAARRGHEILAHVPMEAMAHTDPGPMSLTIGESDTPARLAWSLARVPGLIGINNHEGSKFTADATALAPVAQMLAARHLFFFDSRTSAASQVVTVSRGVGVASAARDIFLDDTVSEAAIRAQLTALVARAHAQGVAIAIGHPHDATLKVLGAWLAEKHGVVLIPLSEAIRRKSAPVAIAAR